MRYRKTSILLVSLGFLALLMVFLLKPRQIEVRSVSEGTESTRSLEPAERRLQDTDGDGLSDLEEYLYMLDPVKADTDNDSIDDGKELKLGRNPAKPESGYGATVEAEEPDGFKEIERGYAALALLAENNLTRRMLASYTKKQPEDKDPEIADFTPLLRTYFSVLAGRLPKFSESAIHDDSISILEKDNHDTLRKYFNRVATVYEGLIHLKDKESEIVATALAERDVEKLKAFSGYRKDVETALLAITKTPVPRPAVAFHKKELWVLKTTVEQIRLLELAKLTDPLYVAFLLELRRSLKNEAAVFHARTVSSWLKERGVTFLPGDKATQFYLLDS